jgi:hypothetical protein
MYFSLQLVYTSIFVRKCIIYYYIHGLRDVVRGLHTGKTLTGRLRLHARRQDGDSLVFGAEKRWTRLDSMGKYNVYLILLYLIIYFVFIIYIFSQIC